MPNKLFLIFILILSSCGSNSQHLKSDSLINYSYLISGGNNGQYFDNGSCFIINYKDKYYLVTNFHVLTAKSPTTNKKLPNIKDTNTVVAVIFRPIHDSLIFNAFEYQLFGFDGSRNYSISLLSNQDILDISVLPIVIPDQVIKHFIRIEDIDSTSRDSAGVSLDIVGFPNGAFINQWQPYEIRGHSVEDTILPPGTINVNFYFDVPTIRGMSGSPIYSILPDGKSKLLGISQATKEHNDSTAAKASGIYIRYALDLIKSSYNANRPSIIGKQIPSR